MTAEALNLPAVALGAALAFVWGMILYHPRVLGGPWARGSRVDPGGPMPVAALALHAAALVALALVIGMTATISYLGTAILAIAAVALSAIAGGAFVRKSAGAMAIDGLHTLVAGILMIGAQAIL